MAGSDGSTSVATTGDVRAARSGDRAAFQRLLARFGPAAHAVVVAQAGVVDAEDLMQEVCLIAWRELEALRDESRFGPWLISIARNAARRSLRTRGARPDARPSEVDPDQLGADEADDARAAAEVLDQLLAVPEAYRELLTMRLVDGLDGPAIAAATGRSHGAVRVALARGMEKLRERLVREGWRS